MCQQDITNMKMLPIISNVSALLFAELMLFATSFLLSQLVATVGAVLCFLSKHPAAFGADSCYRLHGWLLRDRTLWLVD